METTAEGQATAQPEEDEGSPRYHYRWCCETRDTAMRPRGMKMSDGCGHWSVYSSKHRLHEVVLGEEGMPNTWPSATCKNPQCPRKGRLNPNSKDLRWYATRQQAQAEADRLNNERMGYQ